MGWSLVCKQVHAVVTWAAFTIGSHVTCAAAAGLRAHACMCKAMLTRKALSAIEVTLTVIRTG
jgi:hypothetical protein